MDTLYERGLASLTDIAVLRLFADALAIAPHLVNPFAGVECRPAALHAGRIHAKRAIPRRDRRLCFLLISRPSAHASRDVALAIISRQASQQGMHGLIQDFAFQIP